MTVPIDSVCVGDKFGRWTVKEVVSSSCVLCRCSCGTTTERTVSLFDLRHGKSTNCGCRRKEQMSANPIGFKHGGARKKVPHEPEYEAYHSMMQRCYTVTSKAFCNYGERGISVCDRWRESYANFRSDMGPRPSPKHSLDRIDNSGNYEPRNCRWATNTEQNRNKRGVVLNGNSVKTIRLLAKSGLGNSAIARDVGVSAGAISAAVRRETWKDVV
jgi:hypothetical protein